MSIVKGTVRFFSIFAYFCERQIPISYIFHSACKHVIYVQAAQKMHSFYIVFLNIVHIQIEKSDV